MNPLLELLEHGQSYWLDNLTRGKLRSGELERRVHEQGLRGVTSNPAIFHKAIAGGEEYDADIERLVREGLPVSSVYERLVVSDIREACDVLRPVFDGSEGADGFVSLEVSPYLAHDTDASLDEARRLFAAVDRPNVFIKIPGTPAGVPAIEEALFEGININITLLFSIESYEAVADAYLRALERRLEAGLRVDDVASVASFFLSRIDVLVDGLLGHRIRPEELTADPRPEEMLGKAAIANAKLAYQRFLRILESERWRSLEREGAMVQRMLWASTSTKDPLYGDVRYVEPLIGPHTVNTLPDETIEAFADHGRVAATVEDDLDEARRVMGRLEEVGIDFGRVTEQLQAEGVRKFIDPFDRLMAALARSRKAILGGCLASWAVREADLPLEDALESLNARQFGRRLFAKDAALWAADPAASPLAWGLGPDEAESIQDRLGWLDAPESFRAGAGDVRAFADEVRAEGIERVVLLGMGGSSLAAEVYREVLGSGEEWPELLVLDDTDPDAVREVEASSDPDRTLVLVASKSGTTAETMGFFRRFWQAWREALGRDPGDRFVAVTDPGTPLAEEAREKGFRRVFENPADIGGRYSALSWFGLVPAALLGVDLEALLERARAMRASCEPSVPAGENPGLGLGAFLGLAGRRGRDKVTLVPSRSLHAFGAWAEQLLAESTGKRGKGLVPVWDEPGLPGTPARAEGAAGTGRGAGPPRADGASGRTSDGLPPLGPDRCFVSLRLAGDPDDGIGAFLEERAAEGHPVAEIELDDPTELGAEFFRWEVAIAVAGALLGIDPFDEPDVAAAKSATRELLEAWEERGGFGEPEPAAADERLSVFPAEAREGGGAAAGPADVLASFLEGGRPGDYLALLPYLRRTPEREEALARLRARLAARTRLPTTACHGPRYLHSTGQLHKGGPDRGLFLILTAEPGEELAIPGEPYGFATLQRAQALGDFRALAERDRRAVRVHLRGEPAEAIDHVTALLEASGAPQPVGGR